MSASGLGHLPAWHLQVTYGELFLRKWYEQGTSVIWIYKKVVLSRLLIIDTPIINCLANMLLFILQIILTALANQSP